MIGELTIGHKIAPSTLDAVRHQKGIRLDQRGPVRKTYLGKRELDTRINRKKADVDTRDQVARKDRIPAR